MKKHSEESGFALLITLVVVGVVLSVGLSLLDVSVKQVRLSSNAKESELAFHAANAGMECALYLRRVHKDDMETGESISPSCFDEDSDPIIVEADAGSIDPITSGVANEGEAFLYEFAFTWGVGSDERCTQISALVASSSALNSGVTVTNTEDLIPGYPDGMDMTCEPGSKCSVISVRGYNKSCNNITGYGVNQREVLLQF